MKSILILFAVFSASVFAGPLDRPPEKVSIQGRVIQRLPEGLLVLCDREGSIGRKRAEGTVLLKGHDANDGAKVRVAAVPDGTFSYKTVLGAAKIVDAYAVQK